MKAKNTSEKTSLSPNRYNVETFLSSAKISGSALRSATVKSSGVYPIDYDGAKKAGTPIILSFLYKKAGGKKDGKLPAETIGKLLSDFDFSTDEGKKLSKLLPAKYNNFKTLRSRILKEIGRGAILSFSPVKS